MEETPSISTIETPCSTTNISSFKSDSVLYESDSYTSSYSSSSSEESVLSEDHYHGEQGDSFGPYMLEHYIGKGSFGVVWKAKNEEQAVVALKIAREDEESTREITMLSKISRHPNIIELINSFSTKSKRLKKHLVLVFPLYEKDLFSYMDEFEHGIMDVKIAKQLIVQLLRAVDHMEQHKVVHSDLKPENILINEGKGGPTMVVADFGCASFNGSTSDICFYGKTTHYRSPEIIVRALNSVAPPTDIWSAACICFEMVTGEALFDPKSSEQFSGSSLDSEYSYQINYEHLAIIQELLGKFPTSFGKKHRLYFNAKGFLKNNPDIENINMQELLVEEIGIEENVATGLVSFLKPMLLYTIKTRCQASVALEHPFLLEKNE